MAEQELQSAMKPLPAAKANSFPRAIKTVLSVCGLLFFFYLIQRLGWGTIIGNIGRFGAWFAVICLLGAAWVLCQSLAWTMIQNSLSQKVSLLFIIRIRLICDALNLLLPSASLGGDAARAYLLKKKVHLKEGLAGVLMDKTFEFIGGLLFMTVGLVISFLSVRLPRALLVPGILCLVITFVVISALVVLQLKGFTSMLLKITRFIPRLQQLVRSKENEFRTLDANLKKLYAKANWKIPAAIALQFTARMTGAVETLIILRALGAPVQFSEAIYISAVVTIVNTIFFLLPGQWGVMEGAHVLLVKSLHYRSALGLSLGIIRRIRKMVFVAAGLILFTIEKRHAGR